MRALGFWISELFQHLLETCPGFGWLQFWVGRCGVDVEQFDLLGDVVHGPLQVAFFPVGGKIQGLKRRESSHKFFVAQQTLSPSSNFPTNPFELIPTKINAVLLNKPNQCLDISASSVTFINLTNNFIEDKTIVFDKLLSELFDGSIVLNLFLEELCNLSFGCVFHECVGGGQFGGDA